jgi:hypothetical protein
LPWRNGRHSVKAQIFCLDEMVTVSSRHNYFRLNEMVTTLSRTNSPFLPFEGLFRETGTNAILPHTGYFGKTGKTRRYDQAVILPPPLKARFPSLVTVDFSFHASSVFLEFIRSNYFSSHVCACFR